MPLFIDRHDLPDATAEEVAENHARDLGMADEYGVQLLAYWFDADTGGAFCFARASEPDDFAALHRASHGQVANEIIHVSEDDVLRFLGRIHDPVDHTQVTSAFRTILFTDIEGSTDLTQRLGDDGAMRLIRIHDEIIRQALTDEGGRIVKHTGDGIMASFSSVQAALATAVGIQAALGEYNAADPEAPLRVRLGMSAGEPVTEGEDLFGAAVQLAARLCDLARPGTIVVSGVVRDLAIGKAFSFSAPRSERLKGFPEPVSVHELLWSEAG